MKRGVQQKQTKETKGQIGDEPPSLKLWRQGGVGHEVSAAPGGAYSIGAMVPTAEAVGYSRTPSRLRRASAGKPADEDEDGGYRTR
jgi:hypothetical protein